MSKIQAYDIDGNEINHNDIVEIVNNPKPSHSWLKEGYTLKVHNWENRNWFGENRHVIVFLKSKTGGRYCQQGINEKQLRVLKKG